MKYIFCTWHHGFIILGYPRRYPVIETMHSVIRHCILDGAAVDSRSRPIKDLDGAIYVRLIVP